LMGHQPIELAQSESLCRKEFRTSTQAPNFFYCCSTFILDAYKKKSSPPHIPQNKGYWRTVGEFSNRPPVKGRSPGPKDLALVPRRSPHILVDPLVYSSVLSRSDRVKGAFQKDSPVGERSPFSPACIEFSTEPVYPTFRSTFAAVAVYGSVLPKTPAQPFSTTE